LVPGLHVFWLFFGFPFCLSRDSFSHRFLLDFFAPSKEETTKNLSETKSIVANTEMAEQDYPIKMYYYLTLKFKQMKCATAHKPHRQCLPAVAPDLPVTSCQTLCLVAHQAGFAFPLFFYRFIKN
jgi:hypothetical protein